MTGQVLRRFRFLENIILLCFLFLGSSSPLYSGSEKERDQLLGNILKGKLENMHYSKKIVNDQLSERAFNIFLERIDYNKSYLLQKDISKLEVYRKKLDEALLYGDFSFIRVSTDIFQKRVRGAHKIVKELLNKPFNFKKNEDFETDPKKRHFAKDSKALKERWRKILKYNVLNQFMIMQEEQEEYQKQQKEEAAKKKKQKKEAKKKVMAKAKDKADKKPEKKKEKKKILSDKEMEKKAREKIAKTYERVFLRLKDQDHDDELERYFNSLAMAFDPHTNYFPPDKKEDFDMEMRGSLEGIGALLQEDGAYIKVVRIIPGSASWRQKDLKPEDIILKVAQAEGDPVDIVNMRIRDAVKLIRGKKGTVVKLTVRKPDGKIKVIPIERDVVQIEETYAKSTVISQNKKDLKFGYIYLPKFYRDFEAQGFGKVGRNSTDDIRKKLELFKKSQVDGVILDLRNNGGGALEDARLVSGLFLKKGPIVQVKRSDGEMDVLEDSDGDIFYRGPLVVMVNQLSASASEIVAGALQDYGRALIVGSDQTHGKGTVQAFINLDRGLSTLARQYTPLGALKVTIQKFYRVSGASTQERGIHSDVVLPDPYEYLESGERHLDYALPWGEVEGLPFDKWKVKKWDIKKLTSDSKKRVEKDENFKRIKETIKIMKEKKDQTVVTLNYAQLKKEQDEHEKRIESLKESKAYKDLKFWGQDGKVIPIVYDDPKKKKDGKSKAEEEKKKKAEAEILKKDNAARMAHVKEELREEWLEGLSKDAYLYETVHLLQDMVKAQRN